MTAETMTLETMTARLHNHLAELERAIDMNTDIITAWPFVVRLGGGCGLYVEATTEGRQVTAATARPITKATRFSREDARKVAANVKNGAAESEAVGYLQALHEEREILTKVLASLAA